MKTRKHHNNKGLRQAKNGKTKRFIKRLANILGIEYSETTKKYRRTAAMSDADAIASDWQEVGNDISSVTGNDSD